MQEAKLYLIFEFLTMDLKKYMDTNIPKDGQMDPKLTKSYLYQVMNSESSIKSSNINFQFFSCFKEFCFVISEEFCTETWSHRIFSSTRMDASKLQILASLGRYVIWDFRNHLFNLKWQGDGEYKCRYLCKDPNLLVIVRKIAGKDNTLDMINVWHLKIEVISCFIR